MKKRTWLVVIVSLVVLAAAVVVLNLTLRGSRYETAVAVRAHPVAHGRLEDRVSGNGSFTPRTSITVVAQVSGEVEAIAVREGDRVKAGAVLVRLRDDDYALARDKARAALESARRGVAQSLVTLRSQYRAAAASLSDAKIALDRNRELFASKSISEDTLQRSQSAYDAAELNVQSLREQLNLRLGARLTAEPELDASRDAAIIEASPEVEQATLAVRSAEDSIRRCTVVSPVAGTVTMVKPSVGDLAAASSPLARVESLDDMLAEIQIDEVDVGKIREGLAVEVTSDSLIGTALTGVVESIAPTISTVGATRVSLVEVRITGTAGGGSRPELRAGASCSARISANVRQDVLVVPISAIVTEDSLSYAFVLVPTGAANRAGAEVFSLSRREIRTGTSDVTDGEVLSGLAEGDRVATGSLKLLRDGILVTVRPEEPTR
ncbi:MAG: HlyD family efflux transporter periplasmic adaptor subunit [Spirochaetes bacterium]|nr:HlyD family efflux transporter periplasmic adaptor subunit [Spirochaetota bacterium]